MKGALGPSPGPGPGPRAGARARARAGAGMMSQGARSPAGPVRAVLCRARRVRAGRG
ncbi:MAG TPA: hypothetical protein VF188_10425 [Longimicrobiales bacterium]